MSNTPFHLSDHDACILSRALVGLPYDDMTPSPLFRLLLGNLDLKQPDDLGFLRRALGPDVMLEILKVEPTAAPPEPTRRASDLNRVPDLPDNVQLTLEQVEAAGTVGGWLNDYITWAGDAANETPLSFHQGAGLYLASIAIGRRLYVYTPWQQQVYPNLYVMLVAVSTYYRKSAGLSLASKVARLAIPHMVMPQPGSPENFMSMLGGVLPSNITDIRQIDRERLEQGNRFAAQRGLLRDELSGLFKSMGRDYMAGLKELIMTLYDCPAYLDSNTNNKGLVVIRDAALSILGAATPAELGHALSPADWYNGNLARFALLTPEQDYTERPASPDQIEPTELADRLRKLHEHLPAPIQSNEQSSESWSLSAGIWEQAHAYEQALREMTAPGSSLDDRLRSIYGRLHVQAIKVATLLAALDWADANPSDARPQITSAHWYRAQMISESWRACAHCLLADLGEQEEIRLENRIVNLLKSSSQPVTAREIYRALRSPRKPVIEALKALESDGMVEAVDTLPTPGKKSETYRYCGT